MLQRSLSLSALAIATLFVGSCGFAPMYGDYTDAKTRQAEAPESILSQIEIGIIPDRDGQILRNHLIDRFYVGAAPSATPLYRLTVSAVQESRKELAITKTAETTRAQLHLKASMKLTSSTTDKSLLVKEVKAVIGFNILESEFATRVAEQGARDSALSDLARQIELNTVLFLHRGSEPAAAPPATTAP